MGIMCDRYGRKYTLFYGVCVISISLALMPLSVNIYPMYLLFRILYAHGGITVSIVPLLADYVTNTTKVNQNKLLCVYIFLMQGKGAAINVVFASLGAVCSVEIINNGLVNKLEIKTIYWIISFCYFILGAFMCVYIKNGKYYQDN